MTLLETEQRCPKCGISAVKPDVADVVPLFRPTGKRLSEGRWTKPSEFCREPARWTSQDGDSTEWEVSELIGGLIRGLQPEVVVETGSAWGQTTKMIGQVLLANGHGTCYSIEPDPQRFAYVQWYCHNEICDGAVKVVQGESLDFTPPEGHIDFLFSDSLYVLRAAELERFRPWMDESGFVCVHDTAPGHGHHPAEIADSDLHTLIEAVPGYRSLRLHTPRGLTLLTPC